MALGASGIVSVVGNIVPKDAQAICRQFGAGDLAGARAAHYRLFALCREMLSLATNPIPVKAAMKLLGRGNGALRLPLTPLPADAEAKLGATLKEYARTKVQATLKAADHCETSAEGNARQPAPAPPRRRRG